MEISNHDGLVMIIGRLGAENMRLSMQVSVLEAEVERLREAADAKPATRKKTGG